MPRVEGWKMGAHLDMLHWSNQFARMAKPFEAPILVSQVQKMRTITIVVTGQAS